MNTIIDFNEEVNTIINAINSNLIPFDQTLKNVDSEIVVAIGNYFADNEQYDKMEKCYLIASEKNDKDAYYNLVVYYKEIGRYTDVIKYLELCDNPESHFELGNYYRKINNIEKMLYHWNKSNTSQALTNLGIYYYDIKNEKNMIDYWIKANTKDSLLRLSKYYLENMDIDKMTEYFNMSLYLE